MTERMTKGEREELQALVRQRQKVFNTAAEQRAAELLADFDNQLGSQYAFNDDAVWEKATKEAEHEVEKAKRKIAARCRELGIPERFAPDLELSWYHRGENAVKDRRAELRTMAKTRINALLAKAKVRVATDCLRVSEQITLAGLTSEAALALINGLTPIDAQMPSLSFDEVAGEAEIPPAEQLVTPNAIRQRRFRERQRALRNGEITGQITEGDDQ
jgi:hypothetical protein